ncbi:FMN-binding glutamate synthase family protein [Candidatus Pacearchaeota archaeon]|jgi:glutamate synthase domain-containing protein 2|nr:FMN-binding glutamate synthase family protein [Candidatus Pacearchaeota archaeon]|tara:strand:- start:2344 stop:3534 length:1191 start_codon:yes stop_codon:yes gene_type:complete
MAEKWILEVQKRAKQGKPIITSGRGENYKKIDFSDLIFMPAQLTTRPKDYFREEIKTETILGKTSNKPLKLSMPILTAAMSFGALSAGAKIALAKGSTIAGTADNTGEGGMLKEQKENAKLIIAQYSTGRFGVDEEYLKGADAIEVKIGQGAKPGQGGLLPKEKITEKIAEVRKVTRNQDVHSPPYHSDINNIDDLRKKVEWLRELNGGKPIIIKLGAGNVEKDVELALKANPDIIAIDGISGGTGAAPKALLDDFGLPIIPAIVKARKVLDRENAKQELIVGGGFNTGIEISKALALGADAVFVGTALMVAMGCVYCRQCHLGKCTSGIATQDPELEKKLDPNAGEKVGNFFKACNEEIKMAAAAIGHDDVSKLEKKDLRSLSLLMKEVSGVELV